MQRLCIVLALVAMLCPSLATGADVPASELLRYIDLADRHYAHVSDYTAMMLSRERRSDVLQPLERVWIKFQRPFKVYMRWLDGPSKGREGLYVSGANSGKFLISEPKGIQRLFTAALDPSDRRVLEQSRHPVTDIGIGRLLEIVGDNARRGAREGVLRVVDRGTADLYGRRVRQLESILPKDASLGYYGYRVELAFDEENHLPIRVMVYDWSDQLVEDYLYTELRLNPGLAGQDFDPGNKEYGFSFVRIPVPG